MKKSAFALIAAMTLANTAAFAAETSFVASQPAGQVDQHQTSTSPADHPKGGHEFHGPRHQGGPRGEGPQGFAKDLNLSKEQREVMYHTMHEEMHQQKVIVGSYLGKLPKADQDALAAELKASHDNQVEKFLAALTPEQKIKAQEAFKTFSKGGGL
jgi:Spy/CpxP family protein refolding chaperone